MSVPNQMSNEVEQMLGEAVKSELYASHLYKYLANVMQRIGYFGAQKYFAAESADELTHYQKHVEFFNELGGMAPTPDLPMIDEPVSTLRDAVVFAYNTETQLMTKYATWYASADAITQQHLLQFLEIQRKSVGEYGDWIARLDRAGGDPCGVLLVDQEMGE